MIGVNLLANGILMSFNLNNVIKKIMTVIRVER